MTTFLPTDVDLARRAFLLGQQWGLTSHCALHAAALTRAKPGLRVTSGRRSAEENRRIGGSPTSYHLQGRAIDLAGSLSDLIDARAIARDQRVTAWCTGPEEVLLEGPNDPHSTGLHLHVAW